MRQIYKAARISAKLAQGFINNMKKLLLFIILGSLFSAMPHKFYVSKTVIEYNPRSHSFEVTCKIFTDDLERALGDSNENPIRLGSEKEIKNADELIENYLKSHLKIRYNDEPIHMTFLGKEAEADLTFCYFEFVKPSEYNTISIENTILYEHFPDQKNIVDVVANGSTKTVIFVKEKSKEIILR